jgi:acetyltransferase-like isoleucine patch superfamily enzyme
VVDIRQARRHFWDYARGVLRGHPGVRIQRGVKLNGPGTYDLHRGATLAKGAQIYVGPGATLTVEHGAKVGIRNIVNVATGVTIGSGSELSWDVQVLDTDFHRIQAADGTVRPHTRRITLEARTLVGTGSIILKGVTVGTGAVIGSGSVVRRDVPPKAIVAGNPAEIVGHAESWG